MDKIIEEIKEELKKQRISESELARREGIDQNKINRFLRGVTKRLDLDLVKQLQAALGIISEQQQECESDSFQISVNSDEKELLKCYRRLGAEQKKSAYHMILGLVLLKQQLTTFGGDNS